MLSRRALLIGAPLDGLQGVENDVEAMAQVLGGKGFEIARCVGEEATRAGVLEAYEQLIARTGPGDAVVVYYSGHGGIAYSNGDEVIQFIAPVDYPASSPGDFRGIASAELSALLTRLTERTENATVILDCCHATHMSRDPRQRERALSEPASYEDLVAHLDQLQREGVLGPESLRAAGNRSAVRIVACATRQSAYEYRGRAGLCIGMLTEALVEALAELGDKRITWAALMDRVRRCVLELEPEQRPEVEGPSRRIVLDATQDDAVSALRVDDVGVPPGRARLVYASLFGVRVGDRFAIVPPGAGEDRPDPIGKLEVDQVGPSYAEGPLTLRPGRTRVPLGARALLTAASMPAFPVSLPADGPHAAELAEAVAESAALRVVGPQERWLARVIVGAQGELTVADRLGPLYPPCPATRDAVAAVVRDLRFLAQASTLLLSTSTAAPAGSGPARRPDAEVKIVWGVTRRGVRHALPHSGATVRVGDALYINVRNDGFRELFVSLVDVGVTGCITVLTQEEAPSGVALAPGRRFEFGGPLGWPAGLDPRVVRPETVLALVSAAPHDLSALVQDGVKDRTRIAEPEYRGIGSASGGLDVYRVEFELEAVRQ